MGLFFKRIKKTAEVVAVEQFNSELDELLSKNDYISDRECTLFIERFSKVYDTFTTIKSSDLLTAYCKKNKIKRDFIENFLSVFKILKSVISAHNEKLTETVTAQQTDKGNMLTDGLKEYDVVDYYEIEQSPKIN